MVSTSKCVICEGGIHRLRSAIVAPFLAKRVWNRLPFKVELVGCAGCGFMFYNPRLEPHEEARLYSAYRSREYQQTRQSSEPWYTAEFNSQLGSTSSYAIRRNILAGILRKHLNGSSIKSVLDYGGDRGDLVDGLVPGATSYVYDISCIPPAAGVIATHDPAACEPDLIVNSNVLEHVAFPRDHLQQLLKAARRGCFVFLEVPSESPFGWSRIARRTAQIGAVAVTRPHLIPSILRPASLYMMHEHVNYFTEDILESLARSAGCSVRAKGSYALNCSAGKAEMAWCLAQA